MGKIHQRKIAMINDISGYGRCSLTVAIPILSAMGVQCCPVPTSILSNHTGFPVWFFDDYTDKMGQYLEKWKEHKIGAAGRKSKKCRRQLFLWTKRKAATYTEGKA